MKTILVVEDSEIAQRVMQLMIKDSGCQSDIASTGTEALVFFNKNQYDLIFIDISLPDIDGFTVIEEMRKMDPQKARVPIFILSAYSDMLYQNKAKAMQLDAYMVKPIMPENFQKIIEKCFKTSKIREVG